MLAFDCSLIHAKQSIQNVELIIKNQRMITNIIGKISNSLDSLKSLNRQKLPLNDWKILENWLFTIKWMTWIQI